MPTLNSQTPGFGRERLRFFNTLLSLLFVGLFLVALHFVDAEHNRKTRAELERYALAFTRDLRETLRLSVESLRATSNLVVFFEDMSFTEFQALTAQNFQADPGLFMIEWQPRVAGVDREQFEARARARGLPDFRIWEPDSNGSPIPALERDEHVPVYFMRSRDITNDAKATIGLDLAWSPRRMLSKRDAGLAGRARASQLFPIVTGPESDYQPLGFAITLPIYGGGYVPLERDDRQADLIGFMAGVYALENMLEEPLRSLNDLGINIDLYDLAENPYHLIADAGPATAFRHAVELNLYENRLGLELAATDTFVWQQFDVLWLVLPASVVVFGAMTFWFLVRLERRHRQLSQAQIELSELNVRLEDQTRHDPLTGIYNRRAFEERLHEDIDRFDRHGEFISLLMIDIDHFKDVNDGWGHNAGDEVLRQFSAICKSASRGSDMVARWGGEEFAIVLAHTDGDEAEQFAERLRARTEAMEVVTDNSETKIRITISIGISTIRKSMAAKKWIEQADKALYLAKRSGRNCVKTFE